MMYVNSDGYYEKVFFTLVIDSDMMYVNSDGYYKKVFFIL